MKHVSAPRVLGALLCSIVLITFTLVAMTATPVTAQPPSVTPGPAALAPLTICFVSHNQTACVDRPSLSAPSTITEQIRSLTQQLLSGPTREEQAAGAASSLPEGTRLDAVSVSHDRARIDLSLAPDALAALTDQQVEDINEQFRTTFTPYNFQGIDLNARRSDGVYQPLAQFLKPIEMPHKDTHSSSPAPAVTEENKGGLSNKSVFVSAGHGWYWNTTLNSFKTQRPAYPTAPYPTGEGIVEDFNNAEAVNQYLLPYLWNAGANTWTVRERDLNTEMIIVDDSSSGFNTTGSWTSDSGGYNGTYRSAVTVNASPTATATWTFTPSNTSHYAVYVHFPSAAQTYAADAHFYVQHAGAATLITIPQTRDANNWRFIGRYPFYGGQAARIYLTNQSAAAGATIMADAVRIGGGVGDTSVAGSPISNKPRWEEQARQYAKWVGMPSVDDLNDVIVRPIYSEWEKDPGEDAVYVSWHTNGYNGYNTIARGTETYIHSFEPTPNSNILQNFIHAELLNDIHTGWEAGWPDRGKKTQDLGELRLLDTMPGVLIENGYHDNPTDVEAMKDPRFLQLSARAIYHGLVRYWNSLDPNVPLVFLPEPPQQVVMRNNGTGKITIGWLPGPTDGDGPLGDAGTAYRVYTSTDGFGWSNPIAVSTTSYTLTGLLPNQLIFVKVTGVNAGGESLPTPVLAARAAGDGLAHVLIVHGFDRIDRYGDIKQNDPPEGYSRRVFIDRINRYDAIVRHAEVLTLPFDSVQHAVVSNNAIGLGNYTIVDWIAGEDQAPFTPLTANDQTALSSFLANGGALFISGSEIGYELKNTPFYANTLRASYVADDAQTYMANPTPSGLFNSLGVTNFDDGSHGMYDVDYADVFAPVNGAMSSLVYNTASAALQYSSGCTRLVYSGVPFETIYPQSARQAMMTRLISFLGACLPVNVDTTIVSPLDGSFVRTVPAFSGGASSSASQVQVSLRRVSDSNFYNGSSFVAQAEIWLSAVNVSPWSYALPALNDGAYALRARAVASGSIVDPSPAAVTFTLDTVAPLTPQPITPTNGVSLLAIAPLFQWTGGGDPARFMIEVDSVTQMLNSPHLSATLVVTEGVHHWRVRAFDAAGNQSGWSSTASFNSTALKVYLPVIVKNYAAPSIPPMVGCSDSVVNGGFESGDFAPGWNRVALNPPSLVVTGPVAGGTYAARSGAPTITGTSVTGYSSFEQVLSIPAQTTTATVSFERYRYSGDTSDTQYIVVVDTSGKVLDYLALEHVNQPGWLPATFDLTPYAGQTIRLRFGVVNNGSGGATGMLIDKVQTFICVPQ